MNKKVRNMLRLRDIPYRANDTTAYSLARANLKQGSKAAKLNYRLRIEDNFNNNDPWCMWQGIKAITDYKMKDNLNVSSNSSLAEDLNKLFARFDKDNNNREKDSLPPDHQGLTLDTNELRRALHSLNAGKAAGPDGIPGRVLQECTDQHFQPLPDLCCCPYVPQI